MLGGRTFRAGAFACALVAVATGCSFFPAHTPKDGDGDAKRRPLASSGSGPAKKAPHQPPESNAAQTDDLWARIAIELRMGATGTPEAVDAQAFYARNVAYVEAASERAGPYLHFIYHEIAERGLPFEIALLPIIESGYAPRATSPGGAAGLWQLIATTGRRLGLQQTRWYDGRRDIIDSTRAALDYLEALRDRFRGDWLLAFAAYNCGERTVERAIERNRRAGLPTHFDALDLPQETERYVPRLLALVEMFARPQAHHLTLARVADVPVFETVDVGAPLDLNRVVAWSGIDAETFDALNPGFLTRFTVAGSPTRVLLPVGSAAPVGLALADLTAEQRRAPRVHTVQAGETLSHIAAHSGVTVAALRNVNDLVDNRIGAGQQLLIPTPATVEATAGLLETGPAGRAVHVIMPGDTLWDLARLYRTTPAALAALNGMKVTGTLRPGRELRLPGSAPSAAKGPASIEYEVRQGDSLWTISKRFKVSVADLKRWNRLSSRRILQPGQKLVVNRPARADSHLEI